MPVVEQVDFYAFSDEGSLVYQTQMRDQGGRLLVFVDRNGIEETLSAPVGSYTSPKVSPDGQRIALSVGTELLDVELWVYNLDRSTFQRLTFDGGVAPQYWSPDGKEIYYTQFPEGNIWVRAVNGTGVARQVTSGPRWQFSSQHGLVSDCDQTFLDCDIGVLSPESETGVELILQTDHATAQSTISPDGRWLAYGSTESGQGEIYVQSYPNLDAGKWIVSAAGGTTPIWSPDGQELYYASLDNKVMAIPINASGGAAFVAGTPQALFDAEEYRQLGSIVLDLEITPDGKRFLFTKTVRQESQRTIVVENFFDELERLLPTR